MQSIINMHVFILVNDTRMSSKCTCSCSLGIYENSHLSIFSFAFLLNFSHFMDIYSHWLTKKSPVYLF